ncbi:putative addiction module component, TIGR02574 family [Desulfuromusa kysingii]|uniref:Putative addiction module component, TIGR02574 family n=1 Tax=Desulfuromusa kysingii TaxID=37625 RepID=A0A1H4CXU5_9BACT|nr:addiction module protein [Desulfuromusa kysingii]SEA64932.1 putative addiction module component, TIGR02574 family [Desulfuromusa kysingii]
MLTELMKCEQQAKKMPLQERALLIRHLIEGLDDLDEQNLQHLWMQEASRRFQEFKDGKITARSSRDVFREVRKKIKTI